MKTAFRDEVNEVLTDIASLLLKKNESYGDSALTPIRIFSQADPVEQINVRIDDKLSRLGRGTQEIQEDTVNDLLGYLVLLKIAKKRHADAL